MTDPVYPSTAELRNISPSTLQHFYYMLVSLFLATLSHLLAEESKVTVSYDKHYQQLWPRMFNETDLIC